MSIDKLGKKAAVIGFGVTGQAVARYLISKGKEVVIYDSRPESDFETGLLEEFSDISFNFENNKYEATDFDFIVASPSVHLDTPEIEKARENNIPVFNDITLFIKEWQRKGNKVVGVTGSNGKTTIVSLMYDVLKDSEPVILGGNIGNSPLDILDKKHNKGTWAILELSSYQLELLDKDYLDISVISNLSSNHLDRYHGKMDDYARAKTLGIDSKNTQVIVDIDDEGMQKYIMPILQDKRIKKIDTVSMQIPIDQVSNPGVYTDGDNLVFVDGEDKKVVLENYEDVKLVGNHNLYNVALAVDAIYRMGIEVSGDIIDKIRKFEGLEHRIEFVAEIDGVTYINDSKSTSPDSTRSALEAVSNGKNVVLIIGGEDKDMSFDLLKESLSEYVKSIILLPGGIDKKIIKLVNDLDIPLIKAEGMKEAVEVASKVSGSGDATLLSPASASFRDYKSFEERGRDFKDKVLNINVGSN